MMSLLCFYLFWVFLCKCDLQVNMALAALSPCCQGWSAFIQVGLLSDVSFHCNILNILRICVACWFSSVSSVLIRTFFQILQLHGQVPSKAVKLESHHHVGMLGTSLRRGQRPGQRISSSALSMISLSWGDAWAREAGKGKGESHDSCRTVASQVRRRSTNALESGPRRNMLCLGLWTFNRVGSQGMRPRRDVFEVGTSSVKWMPGTWHRERRADLSGCSSIGFVCECPPPEQGKESTNR